MRMHDKTSNWFDTGKTTVFRFVQYKLFYPHFLRVEKEKNVLYSFANYFWDTRTNDVNLATERVKQTYADFLSVVGPLYAISLIHFSISLFLVNSM